MDREGDKLLLFRLKRIRMPYLRSDPRATMSFEGKAGVETRWLLALNAPIDALRADHARVCPRDIAALTASPP